MNGNKNVQFSSKSSDWSTPQYLYDELNEEFKFTLDPCASDDNHKCDKYYTIEDDGLSKDWSSERVFMNPPYGRGIGDWMAKAASSGGLVVCLVPSRTDTLWWHDNVDKATDIRFIKGRVKFGGCKDNAPFPSCIIVFNGDKNGR